VRKIIKGKDYQILGFSPYFKKKYGTSTPIITIDGEDVDLFHGKRWYNLRDNMANMLFEKRVTDEGHHMDWKERVYGGQIKDEKGQRHSELAYEHEIQEIFDA